MKTDFIIAHTIEFLSQLKIDLDIDISISRT